MFQVEFNMSKKYEFPNFVICPNEWIDEEKVYDYKLSWNAIFYALSFATVIDYHSATSKNISLENGQHEYDKFVKENNLSNLFDFYFFIAKDGKDIFQQCYKSDKVDCNSVSQMVYMMEQICYLPKLSAMDCNLQTANVPVLLYIFRQKSSTNDLLASMKKNHELIVNPQYRVFKLFEETIPLFKGTKIGIKVSGKKFIMVSKKDKYPCVVNTTYSQMLCHHHCMEEESSLKRANCARITYFIERPYLFETKQPCNMSYLLNAENKYFKEIFSELTTKCANRCLPCCTKLLYQVSTMLKSLPMHNESGESIVEISYDVCESGMEVVEEYFGYPTETFIANIGGVLGLWLGASAVTFVQLTMFITQLVVAYMKRKETQFISPKRKLRRKTDDRHPNELFHCSTENIFQ